MILSPYEVNQILEVVDALVAEAWSEGRIDMNTSLQVSMALGLLQQAHIELLQIRGEE